MLSGSCRFDFSDFPDFPDFLRLPSTLFQPGDDDDDDDDDVGADAIGLLLDCLLDTGITVHYVIL